MIILNTTFHIHDEVHGDALDYLKTIYIPQATKSGIFSEPHLRKIFGHDGDDGHSYSVQFSVADLEALEKWNEITGRALNAELVARFSDKIAGFSTLLQEVDL